MSSVATSSLTRRHDLSAASPTSAVPESLLAELQSVSERVAKVVSEESHKLALERVALEARRLCRNEDRCGRPASAAQEAGLGQGWPRLAEAGRSVWQPEA